MRYFEKYDEDIHLNFSEVWRKDDRRSYCANSDLFYRNIEPIVTEQLPPEEFKRQAEYYRRRFSR